MSGTTRVTSIVVEALVVSTDVPVRVSSIVVEVLADIPGPPPAARINGVSIPVLRTGGDAARVYGVYVPVLRQDSPTGRIYGAYVPVLRSIEDAAVAPDDAGQAYAIASDWAPL